jgi:hypothetical protein
MRTFLAYSIRARRQTICNTRPDISVQSNLDANTQSSTCETGGAHISPYTKWKSAPKQDSSELRVAELASAVAK